MCACACEGQFNLLIYPVTVRSGILVFVGATIFFEDEDSDWLLDLSAARSCIRLGRQKVSIVESFLWLPAVLLPNVLRVVFR